MTPLRIAAFLHVMSAVLVTGHALFWVIMAYTLRREESGRAPQLLVTINQSRWPPAGPLRLPLPWVGWGLLGAAALTGVLLVGVYGEPFLGLTTGDSRWGGMMVAKLAVFAVLIACQVGVTIRPAPRVAYLNGVAMLAVLLLSAFLRH